MYFFRKAKETLFKMQFVLTDGMKKNSGNPMRSLMILFIIDAFQVLRVMLSPAYGWNAQTYDVGKHADMVYNVTALLSLLVRRFTFFGLAFVLVMFAVGDAFYCAWLFKSGEINKIGPIKALRFMVATLVTTLFSSVMKWLLIPLECLYSEEGNFSENFHGKGAECTPFAFPEILASVPTLIVIVLYVAFAITVAFFSLGTNPLSCAPHVQFTGRVEALFIVSKVFATFMPFLADVITPVGISVIQFALFATVFKYHLSLLPFHHLPTNMLRGGIYLSICWLSLSSVIVSALELLDAISEDAMQTMQWLLLGSTVAAFPVGILLVWRRRNTIEFFIDRLRGEFETKNLQTQKSAGNRKSSRKKGSSLPSVDMKDKRSAEYDSDQDDSFSNTDSSPFPKDFDLAKAGTKPRGALETFFNPAWERKRAFACAQDALSAIRALLMTRSESEMVFLRYMMARALEEHPESQELQVLNVSLLRFVFCSTAESSQAEKRLRTSTTAPAIDHEYLLYAVKRKAAQDFAAASIGNGVINAINLMEFNSRMQQARTAHMQCIIELRKFWGGVSSSKSKEKQGLQQTVDRLVEFNRCVREAQVEYQTLMDKYPQSTQVVATYIAFCDTVLNDPTLANELRKQSEEMQDDDDSGNRERNVDKMNDPTYHAAMEERSQRSGGSGLSENSDYRVKIQRAFAAWSAEIFGVETKDLQWVARRLKVCFAVLFLFSAAGFGVMQFYLFESYAKRDSHLINQTGILRTVVVSALYAVRSQLMAAHQGDTPFFTALGAEISESAKELQTRHYDNYQLARGVVSDFYRGLEETHDLNVPYASGWQVESRSYWNFGNEISQRMDRAAASTMEDLLSDDFDVEGGKLPDSKLNIIFLTENTFRVAIPTFSEVVMLYQNEMQNLWGMTQTMVLSSMGAALATLFVMLALVVFRLFRTIGALQHLHLACHLAVALPLATTRKVAKFYQEAERDMQSLVDEEAAKQGIENDGPDNLDEDETKLDNGDTDASAFENGPIPGRAAQSKREGMQVLGSWKDQEGSPFAGRNCAESEEDEDSGAESGEPEVLSLDADNLSKWTQHLHDGSPMPAARSQRRVSLEGSFSAPKDKPVPARALSPIPAIQAHDSTVKEDGGESKESVPESQPLVEAGGVALATEGAGALAAEGAESPKSSRRKKGKKGKARPTSELPPPESSAQAPPESSARAPAPEPAADAVPAPSTVAPEPPLPVAAPPTGVTDETKKDDHRGDTKSAPDSHEDGDSDGESCGEEEEAPDHKGRSSPGLQLSRRAAREQDDSSLSRVSQSIRTKGRSLMAGIGGILKRGNQNKEPKLMNGSFVTSKNKTLPGGNLKDTEGSQKSTAAEDDVNRLPLREVTTETEENIKLCAKQHERFSARAWVWVLSMTLVVGLSVLLNWYPARRMGTLVLLAPTINHAGRRRTLTRACVHLTRELVINDGFSRMTKVEIAEALTHYLGELRTANDAVRLGGDLDIKVGADARNAKHNELMYMEGCAWRDDPTDCSYPLRPGVASKGLYQLSLSFMQAVEAVLDRYGPPNVQPLAPMPRPKDEVLEEAVHLSYDRVQYNQTRVLKMLEDPDVAFIIDNYSGDLFKGYASIVQLFDDELKMVVSDAMNDNQALFIIFVLVTFGLIYMQLFIRAVKEAYAEGDEARTFVARIPAHTFSPLEVETLSYIFQGPHHHVQED